MNRYAQITKLLRANVGSRRLSAVFDDFIEMTALSFRNAVERDGRADRESRYLAIAGHYSAAQLDRFAAGIAHVVQAMEEEPSDVLGRVYMELELGNEHLGQFFTPDDVSTLMASLVVDELIATIEVDGYTELYEPACGAAAMIIATTQVLRHRGINYQRQLLVTAEDVSPQAVHMAYIHLTLLHVPAVVHRRNTLTQETFDSWPTLAYIMGGWRYRS